MQYKAVVFDMDGVIFDSEAIIIENWKVLGEKYNIPHVEETLYKCLGVNAVETKEIFLREYGQDFPYDAICIEGSKMFHELADGGLLPMKPGVVELLTYLRDTGYKIGLASSTREAVVKQELRDAGILPFFHEVVCGDMVKKSKPDPQIYELACERLGVATKEAIAIEDSFNGIRSAFAAGMAPVMVPDLVHPDEEMKGKAVAILDSLLAVKQWLEEQ